MKFELAARETWSTVPGQRPGYLGKKRDAFTERMDRKYGRGKWRFAWETCGLGLHHYLPVERAILMYEDAYYAFICCESVCAEDPVDGSAERRIALKDGGQTPLAMEIAQYTECYDNGISNVWSGIDYSVQETGSNHYQDIAVRRVLARCGLRFLGRRSELLHIRHDSGQKLGQLLSPGRVPFHIPHLIMQPELNGWWNPRTVEAFWQSNKVIQTSKAGRR